MVVAMRCPYRYGPFIVVGEWLSDPVRVSGTTYVVPLDVSTMDITSPDRPDASRLDEPGQPDHHRTTSLNVKKQFDGEGRNVPDVERRGRRRGEMTVASIARLAGVSAPTVS